MRRARFALAGVLAICFGGCATPPPPLPAPAAEERAATPAAPFTLGVGDKIALNVWRNQDLTRSLVVDPSGNIALPLAGEIRAEGLTLTQLKDEVTARLAKFLVNPQVDVSVSAVLSQKYHVLGEVRNPGSFTLDQRTWVWEALAKSGGFTNDADQEHVFLVRVEGGAVRVNALSMDIKKMIGQEGGDARLFVKNGDILYANPTTVVSIERFMIRLNNILNPLVSLERGIILGPEVIDVLKGDSGSKSVVVSP